MTGLLDEQLPPGLLQALQGLLGGGQQGMQMPPVSGMTNRFIDPNHPLHQGVRDIASRYAEYYKTPGAMLAGEHSGSVQPETPGQWSDRDEARATGTASELTRRGLAMGLDAMTGGMPFAARNSLGMAGGMPPRILPPEGYGGGANTGIKGLASPEGGLLGQSGAARQQLRDELTAGKRAYEDQLPPTNIKTTPGFIEKAIADNAAQSPASTGAGFEQLQQAAIEAGQAGTKANLPPPKPFMDRIWDNYAKRMTPDEFLQSEALWGNAQRMAQASGTSEASAFARIANDIFDRMGTKRNLTVQEANEIMGSQRGTGLLSDILNARKE